LKATKQTQFKRTVAVGEAKREDQLDFNKSNATSIF